jgi:NTP pyrophosphatase (non-canonical NTP hydrolase)
VTPALIDAQNLILTLRTFVAERDWDQFHTPKNLAIALSVEAAELLEPFQWLTPEQPWSITKDHERAAQVAEELADVLEIDLNEAIATKLTANAEKYPADRTRGSAAKYTEYDQ